MILAIGHGFLTRIQGSERWLNSTKFVGLEITGRLKTEKLSPNTDYVAYLVYKLTENSYGLETVPNKGLQLLPPETSKSVEVVMGEFFNKTAGNEEEEVEVSLLETKRLELKSGLIVESIEFRPNLC